MNNFIKGISIGIVGAIIILFVLNDAINQTFGYIGGALVLYGMYVTPKKDKEKL